MAQWGTISYGNTGLTLNPSQGEKPAEAPSGLIVTKAVETKAGWIGQVIVDKEIVWESNAFEDSKAALEDANGLVVDKVKSLFTGTL